jgi:23S rRNA-/tRNA-specific pseudouridylate synthase
MSDLDLNDMSKPAPDVRILLCDENLIIVDKPVNCVVHGNTAGAMILLDALRQFMQSAGLDVSFLAPSNRLDRNTSGPVVFSRNRETAITLRRLFAQCCIDKTYHALLRGSLTESLFVQADIIKGNHRHASVQNLHIIRSDLPDKSVWFQQRTANSTTISGTLIEPLQTAGTITFAAIYPWTGRFHQIRAVCQAIGFPIQGDKKYMGTRNAEAEPGTRHTRQRTDWTIPALICKNLSIPSMNIAVESAASLKL